MIAYCSRRKYGTRATGEMTTHIKYGSLFQFVPRKADKTGDNASESVHRDSEKVRGRRFVPWVRCENGGTLLRILSQNELTELDETR